MHLKFIIVALALAFTACNRTASVEVNADEPDLQAELDSYFHKAWKDLNHKNIKIDSFSLEASEQINEFYKGRDHKTIWTNNLELSPDAVAVTELMQNAHHYGLDTSDYRMEQLLAMQAQVIRLKNDDKKKAIVAYELMMTNECFIFMSHLNQGTLDQDSLWKESKLDQVSIDLVKTLEEGAQNKDIKVAVLKAQPRMFEYGLLQEGLAHYIENYPLSDKTFYLKDPKKDSLKSYDKAQDVLVEYGYLEDSLSTIDSVFEVALKLFQVDNGLEADGKIGRNTRRALMESNYSRYQRLVASLQRLRWEEDTSVNYLRVNIPGYQLKVVAENKVERQFKVVVGAPFTPTPTLDSRMTHFITNPLWYVPYSISKGEIMPKAMKDSTYLKRNGYKVYNGRTQVSSDNVDWSQVRAGKYKIRQNRGRGNALGLVKFIFPNEHSVYLHDTNQKRFFKKDVRAYSHGCMRLQDPFDFADYLVMREEHVITPDSIDSLVSSHTRKTVKLKEALDIHVVYVTCQGSAEGKAVTFRDIYKKDEALVAALFSTPAPEPDK